MDQDLAPTLVQFEEEEEEEEEEEQEQEVDNKEQQEEKQRQQNLPMSGEHISFRQSSFSSSSRMVDIDGQVRMEPLNNPPTSPTQSSADFAAEKAHHFYQKSRPSQLQIDENANNEMMINYSPKANTPSYVPSGFTPQYQAGPAGYNHGTASNMGPMLPSPAQYSSGSYFRYDSPRHSMYVNTGYDYGSTQYSPMNRGGDEMWGSTAPVVESSASQDMSSSNVFMDTNPRYVYPTYPVYPTNSPYASAVSGMQDPNWYQPSTTPRSLNYHVSTPVAPPAQYYDGSYTYAPASYYPTTYYPTPSDPNVYQYPEQYYPAAQESMQYPVSMDNLKAATSSVGSSSASRDAGMEATISKPQFKIRRRKDPSAPKNPKSAYLFFLTEQEL
eukprot:TRINITY_DN465_c0_g1_i2.p1 TRINITY_DN465_c0_g1~~TRINITY_DN465_c0_g1_i2.p1  ORF type:complete len:385 (-),score=73.75 TRINITY_DN465_c0_g1_i2:387-1541(-)